MQDGGRGGHNVTVEERVLHIDDSMSKVKVDCPGREGAQHSIVRHDATCGKLTFTSQFLEPELESNSVHTAKLVLQSLSATFLLHAEKSLLQDDIHCCRTECKRMEMSQEN